MRQYPAIRGKLGSTEYYTIVIKAKRLVSETEIQSPEDWEKSVDDKLSEDEIDQRKLDYNRVVKYIAPYIAEDNDRFFGSIIVAVTLPERWKFVSFDNLLNSEDIKPMYEQFLEKLTTMGMLTIPDSADWRPLDGQHRIAAIRCAIQGKDNKGNEVKHFKGNEDLGDEDVTVILIPYNKVKTRKIFTKVNLYAKRISPGEGLLIDPYDIIAVISREMIDKLGGAGLIGTRKADVGKGEAFFTSLSALAKANVHILNWHFDEKIDRKKLPSHALQQRCKMTVNEVWDHLVKNINIFADALADKGESGDENRKELRENFLLLKPIPQVCLVAAFARMTKDQSFTFKQASDRLNKIDWGVNNPVWRHVVVINEDKITHRHEKLLTSLIYYMAGGKMEPHEKEDILNKYRSLFPADEQSKVKLPPQVS